MAHSNISHDSGCNSCNVRRVPEVWDGWIRIEAIRGRESLSGSFQVFQIVAHLGFMTHTHAYHAWTFEHDATVSIRSEVEGICFGLASTFYSRCSQRRVEGATIFDQNIGTELAILYITLPCMCCCAVGPLLSCGFWAVGAGCKGCKCHYEYYDYDYFYACFLKSKREMVA